MPVGLPITIGNPSFNVQETFNFKEDVSKMTGKHAFKMGYDLMRLRSNSNTSITTTPETSASWAPTASTQRHQHPQHRRRQPGRLMVGRGLSLQRLRQPAQQSAAKLDPQPVLPGRLEGPAQPDRQPGGALAGAEHREQQVRPAVELRPDRAGQHRGRGHGRDHAPQDSCTTRTGTTSSPGSAWLGPRRKNIVVRTGFALSTVDERAAESADRRVRLHHGHEWTRHRANTCPCSAQRGPDLPLVWPVVRADGSIPFSGTNYSSRGATWINPDRVQPLQHELELQRPVRALATTTSWKLSLHRQPQPSRARRLGRSTCALRMGLEPVPDQSGSSSRRWRATPSLTGLGRTSAASFLPGRAPTPSSTPGRSSSRSATPTGLSFLTYYT